MACHAAFAPSATSERPTSLRCSFLHALEGHHPMLYTAWILASHGIDLQVTWQETRDTHAQTFLWGRLVTWCASRWPEAASSTGSASPPLTPPDTMEVPYAQSRNAVSAGHRPGNEYLDRPRPRPPRVPGARHSGFPRRAGASRSSRHCQWPDPPLRGAGHGPHAADYEFQPL